MYPCCWCPHLALTEHSGSCSDGHWSPSDLVHLLPCFLTSSGALVMLNCWYFRALEMLFSPLSWRTFLLLLSFAWRTPVPCFRLRSAFSPQEVFPHPGSFLFSPTLCTPHHVTLMGLHLSGILLPQVNLNCSPSPCLARDSLTKPSGCPHKLLLTSLKGASAQEVLSSLFVMTPSFMPCFIQTFPHASDLENWPCLVLLGKNNHLVATPSASVCEIYKPIWMGRCFLLASYYKGRRDLSSCDWSAFRLLPR